MASGIDKGFDTKRKADESPEVDKPYPRLRRRASLPDLQDAADPKKSYSLPDLMKRGFLDPDIMKDVVPIIMCQLKPSLEQTIKQSVEFAVAGAVSKAMEEAMENFKSEVLKPLLDQKDAEIKTLKDEAVIRDEKVKALEAKVDKLSLGLNDLEQYGRRHNIRLNNVPLEDTSNCESVVLGILNRALTESEPFSSSDIDRCHPIGRPNKKNNRQIIVRFSSYQAKAKAYDARFNLSNIYMTEDFTPTNQKVVSHLVQMKKAKRIKKFWTIDGKIFAKTSDLQPKHRITSIEDVSHMLSAAINEGYVADPDQSQSLLTFQPMQ